MYPPFEFYKNGRYQGFAVDYLDLVAQRLGIRFEPADVSISWSDALNRLRNKALPQNLWVDGSKK